MKNKDSKYSEYQKNANLYFLDINLTKNGVLHLDCCISGFHAKAEGNGYDKLSACMSAFFNEIFFDKLQERFKLAISIGKELPCGIYYLENKDIYKCDYGCGNDFAIADLLGYEFKCFYNRRTEKLCGVTLTKKGE